MNLHRTGKQPQWESVAPEDRNKYQKIAALTNGRITPGNAVSIVGAALVGSGLLDIHKGKVLKGFTKIALGRMADLGDGLAADASGTKSPLGEIVDATIDKAEALVAVPALMIDDVAPKSAGTAIIAQNLASITFSTIARDRGIELHPSEAGKRSTAGQWAAIIMYGMSSLASEANSPKLARGLEIAGHITTVGAVSLGSIAVIGYAQEALGPVPEVTEANFNGPVVQMSVPVSGPVARQ